MNHFIPPSGQAARSKIAGKGWRPFSLKPPYLLLLACISLVLLGVTEHLRRLSQRDIGIYHTNDTDSIPKSVFYAYNNGPTLVAVIYGTLWIFVDLDVSRLEPYFQLSQPRDIPAKILFLDYTFKHMFKVPVRAIQNAHWVVAAVASFNLLITLTLPPLMSGLIVVQPTNITQAASFDSWQTLVSLDDQQDFNAQAAEVINHAGSVAVDSAALPSFVDFMYAVAPFERSDTLILRDSETWTAETDAYFAEPECKEVPDFARSFQANIELQNDTEIGYILLKSHFNDTQLPDTTNTSAACRLTASVQIQILPQDSPGLSNWPQFAPIFDDADIGIPYGGGSLLTTSIPPGCSAFTQLGVVVTVNTTEPLPLSSYDPSAEDSKPSNVSSTQVRAFGIACTPTYRKASSSVTVIASNNSIQNVVPIDQAPAAPTDNNTFDATTFEFGLYGLSGYLSASYDYYVTGDNSSIMTSFPILSQDSIATIAMGSIGDEENVSPDAFRTALQSSYQLAFALAFPKYLDTKAVASQISGNSQIGAFGLFTTQAIAIASEVILAGAALLSIALTIIYHRRSSMLRSDPDSLATMCGLISSSFSRQHYLASSNKGFDDCPTKTLLQAGEDSVYNWTKEDGDWRLQSRASGCITSNKPQNSSADILQSQQIWVKIMRTPIPYHLALQNAELASRYSFYSCVSQPWELFSGPQSRKAVSLLPLEAVPLRCKSFGHFSLLSSQRFCNRCGQHLTETSQPWNPFTGCTEGLLSREPPSVFGTLLDHRLRSCGVLWVVDISLSLSLPLSASRIRFSTWLLGVSSLNRLSQ